MILTKIDGIKMTNRQQLIYKYKTASILEKLIAINVILFVLTFLVKTILFLVGVDANPLIEWLSFPQELSELVFKPWSIITYAFMHAGIWHIIFNMLVLHFGGTHFLTYYSGKRLLNYYIMGAIFGALMYMLSYSLLPAFSSLSQGYMVGASASVMAVFIGITTKVPNTQVRLFVFNLKLWWIAAFFVISDIVQIPLGNAGGHLSHLGGALVGYLYTTQLDKGNDIGKWIENTISSIERFFASKPKSTKSTKARMKTVYKNKSYAKTTINKSEKQKRIDAILDKISKSGYESLSKEEKDFLFNAGKDL
jgi:membrane associated rhomboid family serine protease